jgi:hypothetical protein
MGWKSLEEVMTKRRPEPLRSVFERIAQHREELEDVFSKQRKFETRERLEGVKKAHQEARRRPR